MKRQGNRNLLLIVFAFLFCGEISYSQINVWPGDANDDGIVNNLDLLNVGSGFGKQGNPRDSITTTWQQLQVLPWNDTLPVGLNTGYTDCSGNGFVNIEDVSAIENNYNQVNSNFSGLNFLQGGPGDPALNIISNENFWQPGESVFVTVFLDQDAVDSIYNVAFTFAYDTFLIKEETVVASVHPQFGGGGRQPLQVQWNDTINGELEFAASRTNGSNHGDDIPVCIISFVIEDNLIGKTFIDVTGALSIQKVRMFDRQGVSIPVHGDTIDARIISTVPEKQLASEFSIYPVPANDRLFIDNHGNNKLVAIELMDLNGRVRPVENVRYAQSVALDVTGFPKGIYVLKVVTENGVLYKKVMIER